MHLLLTYSNVRIGIRHRTKQNQRVIAAETTLIFGSIIPYETQQQHTKGNINKTISFAGPWLNGMLDLIRVRINYALGFSSQNNQQPVQLQVQFIYPELSETCN